MAKPFLKWAGGKTQLLPKLLPLFPKNIRTYYEPFVGAGATYFTLAAKGLFERAVINDSNSELMTCYRAIQTYPEELIFTLRQIADEYRKDPKGTYLRWRKAELSEDKAECFVAVEKAARMIFLNKTGFNGLYRVNKAGGFNVPFGDYKNPRICDEKNILAVRETLNSFTHPTTVLSKDFATAVKDAEEGDVVYFDPPYIPKSETSSFTSYTSAGFNLNEHTRLAATFAGLVDRGVTVILSNSATPTARLLYRDFVIKQVRAKRSINSDGKKRGLISELIVVGQYREVKDPLLEIATT